MQIDTVADLLAGGVGYIQCIGSSSGNAECKMCFRLDTFLVMIVSGITIRENKNNIGNPIRQKFFLAVDFMANEQRNKTKIGSITIAASSPC